MTLVAGRCLLLYFGLEFIGNVSGRYGWGGRDRRVHASKKSKNKRNQLQYLLAVCSWGRCLEREEERDCGCCCGDFVYSQKLQLIVSWVFFFFILLNFLFCSGLLMSSFCCIHLWVDDQWVKELCGFCILGIHGRIKNECVRWTFFFLMQGALEF